LTLEIRDCTFRDLHLVVGIHEKAFGGFFMSQLGSDFLFRYYKTIYCYDKPLFKVATLESNIIGFAAGFVSPADFYRFLSSNKLYVGLGALKGLLKNPSLLLPGIRNWFRVRENSASKLDFRYAELASIAVHPKHANSGVGSQLLSSFLTEAKKSGVQFVILTTDAENNDKVNAFYLKNGFKIRRKFYSRPGRLMNEYVKQLS